MNSSAPPPTGANRDLTRLKIDRSESASTGGGRGSSPLLWILVVLLIGYLVWDRFAVESNVPEVEVGRVVRTGGAPNSSGIAANGYVVARKRAAISTDVQGRLVQLEVEEGDRVQEGDLLARLDTRQLEAALEQGRAEVKQQTAAVKLAEIRLERFQGLLEATHATQDEVDTAQAELDGANGRLEAAMARVRETEVLIDKSSVYAPFSGVVTLKNAEVGEVVSSIGAGGGGTSRGAVATLVDFETLEVQVELAQTSLAAAETGAGVQVFLDAYPDRQYPGRVRQIWPTADRQKATVELRVELLERDDRILPELGCRVVFDAPTAGSDEVPRILVPQRAVIPGPSPQVFVVVDDRVVLKSVVLSGEEVDGRVAVREGLTGRELVVLDPSPALADGDNVRRKE